MSTFASPVDFDDDPTDYPPVVHPPFVAEDFARGDLPPLAPGYVSGRLTLRSPGMCKYSIPRDWYCDCACGAKRVRKTASTLRGRSVFWCSMRCPLRSNDISKIRASGRP